ncbi:hypothetical protein [Streptosporangium saharense]|uniref:Uncharacterized protein n=1 Tax=Streptosporangium saharense TaxID=1706840 RepID=A0A7W7QS70_9ACTN|nr:hypothetical protein [Streptosporangium saharense]MBB4918714.1 hypothetical protein [Streptosporangium saharense]
MMSDPVVLALVAGAVRLVVSVVLYRMRSTGGSQARGQVTVVRVRAGEGPVLIGHRTGEGTLIVCLHESPASGLRQRDER